MQNDWYLADRSRLQRQPKRVVADYVESQGILVPKRFGSYLEGKSQSEKSKFQLMARSEHEQDYDGASGLLSSFSYIPFINITSDEEMQERLLQSAGNLTTYCNLMHLDKKKFLKGFSFSFWEHINGLSRMVVADSAVKGRYHVTARLRGVEPGKDASYFIWENGKVIFRSYHLIDNPDIEKTIPEIVDWYEKVRNLPRFDPNHCPIVEAVTLFKGKKAVNYFVQYHRTRDFEPADFELEPQKTPVAIVRGATPRAGIETRVFCDWKHDDPAVFRNQAIIVGKNYSDWTETFTREAAACIGTKHDTLSAASEHKPRSLLFKPRVSLLLEDDSCNSFYEEDGVQPKVRIISDGRRAIISKI